MLSSTARVPDVLVRKLKTRGWTRFTPVQRAVLEVEPPGSDLLVSAPTGSGKTFAFGLLCSGRVLASTADPGARGPFELIIAPTRELAAQVAAELGWLYGDTRVRVGCVTGGADIRAERAALRRGFEILVGSPGRLRGHVERGDLDLSQVECLILDEADELLDMGFREALGAILDATPAGRRTLMFTATVTPQIERLAQRYQKQAQRLDLCPPEGHTQIGFRAMQVAPVDVEATIVNTLRYHDAAAAMVFCNRREGVGVLAVQLAEAGFEVTALSGAMDQQERTEAITSMREGRKRVCVATDVAARGLDLPQCSLVIHADMPQNKATLLHRSGRTGRARRHGLSVLVVPHRERRRAERLIAASGVTMRWVPPPWPADIVRRDQARVRSDALLKLPPTETERQIAALMLEVHGAERLAVALWRSLTSKLPVPRALKGLDASGRAPDFVWFALNRGSRNGATIGHILPMICRIGRLRRRDIGRIRTGEDETRFEVASGEAVAFATAAACHPAPGEQVRRLAEPPVRAAASAAAATDTGGERGEAKAGNIG